MGLDLYNEKYFTASKVFQKNKTRIKYAFDLIKSYSPTSVLDVGCGMGPLVWKLNKNHIRAMGVDFALVLKEKFWSGPYFVCANAKALPFPDKSFDLVYSMDFFEHIEEKDVPIVLGEMKRVGKRIVAVVADDLGGQPKGRARLYHCCHKPLGWWKDKLSEVDVYSGHEFTET
jgi:ubiquinone/menaquinone biosynthesis C-methylase UbiE